MMTATTAPAPAAPTIASLLAEVEPVARGTAARLAAGALHLATGLGVVASVIGIGVAHSIVMRGVVVADSGDVAMLNALAPVAFLFGLVGGLHAIAGIGIMFRSRQAAALGIGLGLFDVVAGFVALALAAGSSGPFDATGLAVLFILGGITLAVLARVADWQTHGPLAEAE